MTAAGALGAGNAAAVVVDVSFAVPWVVREAHSIAAIDRRRAWVRNGVTRIAPALFAPAPATALLKAAGRGAISATAVPRSLAALLRVVTIVPDDEALAARAVAIAQQLGVTKAYDSLYCALAEREGSDFWTGDRRYAITARGAFPFVHWVGEPL